MATSTIDLYKDRLKQSSNYCYPHWDRAIENYKHYLGRLDVGGQTLENYPFQSKMVIPISYETVETVLPRLIGKDPEFTTMAIEPEDVPYEQTAKIAVQSGYDNPKLEILGEPMYLKLQKGVKEELITGNAVWRVRWRRQMRKIVRYLANLETAGIVDSDDINKILEMAEKLKSKGGNGDIKWSKKFEDMPFLDDFDIEHKPFFYFMPDSGFSDLGRMRYKIEREPMTMEDLIDEATVFKYDESKMKEIQEKSDKGESGYSTEVPKDFLLRYNELFANPEDTRAGTTALEDKKSPLLMVDKMWEGDKVHVIVNEKWLLTPDTTGLTNPYNIMADPFLFGSDVTMPHSYFARGEIDAIKKLEDGVTDIHNMRFDNLVQAMLNLWVYNPNMMADGDEFVPIPGSLTAVKDVDRAIRMFTGNDVTQSAYRESDNIMQIIARITGVNDYVRGVEGDSVAGRSYGGMRLVQEFANARFVIKGRTMEKQTLKALGYFDLEMSRQFINKDRMVRMAGRGADDDKSVKLEAAKLKMIKGYMDIRVVPNSAMVVDQQAEVMRVNSVADRFMAQKGPFANIPPEVYDQFLLTYFQKHGFHDGVYWVRAIRESREKMNVDKKEPVKTEVTPPEAPVPQIPAQPTMQSNGIANQPDPLAQIFAAENTLPPPQVVGLNQ